MSIKVLNVSFDNFAFFVKNFRIPSKISLKIFLISRICPVINLKIFMSRICLFYLSKICLKFFMSKMNWTKSGHEKIPDSKYTHFSGRFPDIFETSAQFPDVFQVQHPTKKDLT